MGGVVVIEQFCFFLVKTEFVNIANLTCLRWLGVCVCVCGNFRFDYLVVSTFKWKLEKQVIVLYVYVCVNTSV